MKVKVISLPYIFQVLYVLCFTRPRYQVSVYRTIGPLVLSCNRNKRLSLTECQCVLVQPVEKLIYDENSSVRFNTIKRFETELKLIKLLQSASPLGFNDNIYQEGNISKMPDFDVFSLLEIRQRKRRSHGKRQKEMINVKDVLHKNQALPLITYHQS